MTEETGTRTKGAALCASCGKAIAVWLSREGNVHPIGCGDGCPCGGTSFRVLN